MAAFAPSHDPLPGGGAHIDDEEMTAPAARAFNATLLFGFFGLGAVIHLSLAPLARGRLLLRVALDLVDDVARVVAPFALDRDQQGKVVQFARVSPVT